jgi:hypothetical protein
MARVGFCRQCGNNVWLAEDGSCTHGHSADQIDSTFDVPSRAEESASAVPDPLSFEIAGARRRRRTIVMIASVLTAVLTVAGVITVTYLYAKGMATALTITNKAKTDTSEGICWSQMQLIVIAAEDYRNRHDRLPATMQDLVDEGFLDEMPTCLSHGTYVWDATKGTVSCTAHPSLHVRPVSEPRRRKTTPPRSTFETPTPSHSRNRGVSTGFF